MTRDSGRASRATMKAAILSLLDSHLGRLDVQPNAPMDPMAFTRHMMELEPELKKLGSTAEILAAVDELQKERPSLLFALLAKMIRELAK